MPIQRVLRTGSEAERSYDINYLILLNNGRWKVAVWYRVVSYDRCGLCTNRFTEQNGTAEYSSVWMFRNAADSTCQASPVPDKLTSWSTHNVPEGVTVIEWHHFGLKIYTIFHSLTIFSLRWDRRHVYRYLYWLSLW